MLSGIFAGFSHGFETGQVAEVGFVEHEQESDVGCLKVVELIFLFGSCYGYSDAVSFSFLSKAIELAILALFLAFRFDSLIFLVFIRECVFNVIF